MNHEEILKLDNKILKNDFCINDKNLLIWPLIRPVVHEILVSNEGNSLKPHAKQPRFSFSNLKYLYYTLYYNVSKCKKEYKILFYVPARGRLDDTDFNIYSDYYVPLTDKTLVIDKPFRGRYKLPQNTKNFYTGEYGRLKSFLYSKIRQILLCKKNKDIEKFIQFLKKECSVKNNSLEKIRKKLYEFYCSYDIYKSYHSSILKKLKPKIIFVTAGSYGQYHAMLIKTAKELGIITAEFQHGTISKGHFAYNYGKEVFKSKEYKKYLPDYIFTYGDYWNDQMNIPSETVTIGAPHFYHSIKKYKHIKEKKNTILVVSQGTMTKEFVSIAEYLSEHLPNQKIIFKLHPGEVPFEERYKSLYRFDNIKVAKSGDIFRYLTVCEHIVAHTSTTIFEAMGFNKKIYIIDDKSSRIYIPKNVGIRFRGKDELKELIQNNEKQDTNYNLEYYFNSNWEEKYKRFLSETIAIT